MKILPCLQLRLQQVRLQFLFLTSWRIPCTSPLWFEHRHNWYSTSPTICVEER